MKNIQQYKIDILTQSVPRRRALNHENIQQYKIDILSQSVSRRRTLNHEKYPTIKNWYLITIRPAKASSNHEKYPTIKKINILSQSVQRRGALNHEKYSTIKNWYLITISPTKASSQSWKIFNNKKLISYHNQSHEGELSIMKNIQQYKIDILSQSVPRRRTLNHEKYPTIKNWYLITIRPAKASSQSWKISNNTKLISYHNPSREGELSIMKHI